MEIKISIHTLTWRVTYFGEKGNVRYFNFNPHPHVEGDELPEAKYPFPGDFNPHPHVEGDSALIATSNISGYFNPHPHVEGDENKRDKFVLHRDFNPHPHVEGDCYIWYLLLLNIAYIESYTTLSS